MDSLILLSFVLKRLYRSDDENRFNEKWRNCRMNANSSAFAQAGRTIFSLKSLRPARA